MLRTLSITALIVLTTAAGCKTGASPSAEEATEEAAEDTAVEPDLDRPLFEVVFRDESPSQLRVDGCETNFEAQAFDTTCEGYVLTMSRAAFGTLHWEPSQIDAIFKNIASQSPVRFVLGGPVDHEREGVRHLRSFERGEGEAKSDGILGLVEGAAGLRLFSCQAPEGQALEVATCFDKLPQLVKVIEAHLASENVEVVGLELYGIPLGFDDDCSLEHNSVSCRFASFSWQPASAPDFHGSALQKNGMVAYVQNVAQGEASLRDASCEISNAEVDCYGVVGRIEQHDSTLLVVVGQATDASGQAWTLLCTDFDYAEGQEMPHPCSEVFSVMDVSDEH